MGKTYRSDSNENKNKNKRKSDRRKKRKFDKEFTRYAYNNLEEDTVDHEVYDDTDFEKFPRNEKRSNT